MHKYAVLKLNAVTALLCKGQNQKEKRDHLGILPKCLKEISNQDELENYIRKHGILLKLKNLKECQIFLTLKNLENLLITLRPRLRQCHMRGIGNTLILCIVALFLKS